MHRREGSYTRHLLFFMIQRGNCFSFIKSLLLILIIVYEAWAWFWQKMDNIPVTQKIRSYFSIILALQIFSCYSIPNSSKAVCVFKSWVTCYTKWSIILFLYFVSIKKKPWISSILQKFHVLILSSVFYILIRKYILEYFYSNMKKKLFFCK